LLEELKIGHGLIQPIGDVYIGEGKNGITKSQE
jgi:hypothetical protein